MAKTSHKTIPTTVAIRSGFADVATGGVPPRFLIAITEIIAQANKDPNSIMLAKSPLISRCATAQVLIPMSIGCFSFALMWPVTGRLPATTKTHDIGSSTNIWDKVYIGNLYTPSWADTATATASVTYQNDIIQSITPAAVSLPDGTDGQMKTFVVEVAPSNPVTLAEASAKSFLILNIGTQAPPSILYCTLNTSNFSKSPVSP